MTLLGSAQEVPRVVDSRLELTLFAEDPVLVTPIGMAIDPRDRIFVVESHTHHPAEDYTGPKGDRIKIFRDADLDGRADGFTVFAEGLDATMNMAIGRDGTVYVVCAREVWRLNDRDGDGVSESRDRLLQLKTSNHYAHSALLGITFGPDNWLYLSRGNNGSAAYTCEGTDGSTVSGYGDGGNIMRCRPDGSELEEFATGFWNPFDIKFDHAGRLLCVDNDPDARGPNRFLHIVRDGDYGYKSMYGGGGNHPYQGWEGVLPGTLPMIDGTGEAPSGLLDASWASLPADYTNHYLVTIWNENRIDAYATRRQGVSLRANHQPLVVGGRDFRPVALATDSRGYIYFTDWVLVDYPNHGRGRLWRLRARPDVACEPPKSPYRDISQVKEVRRIEGVMRGAGTEELPEDWPSVLGSDDPFLRHAAVVGVARTQTPKEIAPWLNHPNAVVRESALLALRRVQKTLDPEVIRAALSDQSARVCRLALMWIGEAMEASWRDSIDPVLRRPDLDGVLFETWLATVENLDEDFIKGYRVRTRDKAGQLRRRLPDGLIEALVNDEAMSSRVRGLAMSRMGREGGREHRELLLRLAGQGDPELRREAIRSLGQGGALETASGLQAIALDESAPSVVRAEALVTLSWLHDVPTEAFLPLLDDSPPEVQIEAIRLLRREAWQDPTRAALTRKWEELREKPDRTEVVEHLEFALFPPGTEGAPRRQPRPETVEAWLRTVEQGGDPDAGARVFFSPLTACSRCHLIHNRGGRLGPDLSNLGQSVDRERIAHSILRPSDDVPPQYQAWYVITQDGEIHQGLQLDHKAAGAIELQITDGTTRRFSGAEVKSYGVLKRSLMPDELENTMTVAEFRDLVAFLASLR